MVSFTTDLTGCVDRSWSSLFLNIYIVCVGILRNFEVGVRICLTTIVIVVITSTIRVNLSLVFFSFEVTALPSIVTWLFSVVASWFGFFWVLLCGLLRHSIYLHFSWCFQTIQFRFLSKM